MNNSDDINQLIEAIDDTSIDKEVDLIKKTDPLEILKLDIFNFFSKRLLCIQEKESLTSLIQRKLKEKIENGELEFRDLKDLYKLCLQQSTFATAQITDLFKPAAGAPSPFTETISKKQEEMDDYEKMFDGMSSKELEKVDKMYRLLQAMQKKENENA